MYTRCYYTETVDQWVETYGVQSLAHLSGARKKDGGHTIILSPMNIHLYLIILQLVHPKTPHNDMPVPKEGWDKRWVETEGGPNFYPWFSTKVLNVINRIITLLQDKNRNPINDSDKKWLDRLKKYGYYLIYYHERVE